MLIEVGDARLLSSAAQQVVRLRVVSALEAGRVRSYRQAAETFKVSERSVGTWWRAYRSRRPRGAGRAGEDRDGPGRAPWCRGAGRCLPGDGRPHARGPADRRPAVDPRADRRTD